MNNKIEQLIEAVRYSLKTNQNKEAVRNYNELVGIKEALASKVYEQIQLHANTMDFIFKSKFLSGLREYSYILAATFFGTMALSDDASDKSIILYLILGAIFIFGAFRIVRENRTPNRVWDNLLNRMNAEKASHASILYQIDIIEELQVELGDTIRRLEEKEINSLKEEVRKDLQEKYPELDLSV